MKHENGVPCFSATAACVAQVVWHRLEPRVVRVCVCVFLCVCVCLFVCVRVCVFIIFSDACAAGSVFCMRCLAPAAAPASRSLCMTPGAEVSGRKVSLKHVATATHQCVIATTTKHTHTHISPGLRNTRFRACGRALAMTMGMGMGMVGWMGESTSCDVMWWARSQPKALWRYNVGSVCVCVCVCVHYSLLFTFI